MDTEGCSQRDVISASVLLLVGGDVKEKLQLPIFEFQKDWLGVGERLVSQTGTDRCAWCSAGWFRWAGPQQSLPVPSSVVEQPSSE